VTLKGQTRDPITLNAQYLEKTTSGIPSGRTNNFPESERGLGHVIATVFGIRSNISLKLLELETSNLVHGFLWAMPTRRTNKFP